MSRPGGPRCIRDDSAPRQQVAAGEPEGRTTMSQRTRREFIKQVGAGAVAAAAVAPVAASAASASLGAAPAIATRGRVLGANDRLNVGFVGCGGRMRSHITRIVQRVEGEGRLSGGGGQRHLDQAQGSGARAGRRRREVGLSRLPRADRAARRRRGRDRLAGSLALRSHHGGPQGRQARLSRKADDLHGQRGEGDHRRGEAHRQGAAGRQPVHARSITSGRRRRRSTTG